MAHRPQPYYARFNQPPRSPNGRNRQSAPQNHSDPTDRTDPSPGRPEAGDIAQWAWTRIPASGPLLPFPNPNYSAIDMVKMIADMQQSVINRVYYGADPVYPPAVPYAGVISGEITGYRGWIVCDVPEGPTLCSLAHQFLWQPGATIEGNIDECVYNNSFISIYGGVYAFREFSGLADEITAASYVSPWPLYRYDKASIKHTQLGLAFGTVKLWGETVEHETGYRASFAKLTSLDSFIGVEGFDLDSLRRKYGV